MELPIFQRTVVKDNGDIIPNAQVEVRLESNGALATLYSDRAGTVSLSNPFNAYSTGLAEFYASSGEYNITATGDGSEIIWRYFALVDLATLGDPATIVHAPGSGLYNEAGTAYSSDVTTSPTDTTAGRLLKVGDNGTSQFPLLAPKASPSFTGQPTVNGVDSYHQGNILGTVSATGTYPNLVPTGAIMERGSNANGSYIKYADGTMICHHVSATLSNTTVLSGSVYYSGLQALTFPHAFVSVPSVIESVVRSSGVCWAYGNMAATTTTVNLGVAGTLSTNSGYPAYVALGRWM